MTVAEALASMGAKLMDAKTIPRPLIGIERERYIASRYCQPRAETNRTGLGIDAAAGGVSCGAASVTSQRSNNGFTVKIQRCDAVFPNADGP